MTPSTPSKRDENHRNSRALSDAPSIQKEAEERLSGVRVLHTSLPFIHEDILEQRRKAREAGEDPDLAVHAQKAESEGSSTDRSSPSIPEQKIDPSTNQLVVRSKEEQEATSRALKPRVRIPNAVNEPRSHREKPEGLTKMPENAPPAIPKPKGRRWQFGIRSRNTPFEAMKCLFNALEAQKAVWEVIPALANETDHSGDEGKEDIPASPPRLGEGEQHTILQSRYAGLPNGYYIPRDPWFIRARMLKRGMFAPGDHPTFSATSSNVNLLAEQHLRKKVEEMGGYLSNDFQNGVKMNGTEGSISTPTSQPNSAQNTRPSSGVGEASATGHDALTGGGEIVSRPGSMTSAPGREPNANIGVWVFIDIQLYILETNNFMVDFKCDGYQNVRFDPNWLSRTPRTGNSSRMTSPAQSRPTSGFSATKQGEQQQHNVDGHGKSEGENGESRGEWRPVSKRFRNKDKEITSPYPYLDVASDLIAQLAVAN